MTDEPTGHPPARPKPDPRFAWHPEPELIGIRDGAVSRPALERLGVAAWATALDYIYGEAFRRAMGEPAEYGALRRTYFGTAEGAPTDRAGRPRPTDPSPSAAVLGEFTERLAPYQLNAYHPRSLSYFTPPPLAMSRRRRAARPGHPAGRRRLARRPDRARSSRRRSSAG